MLSVTRADARSWRREKFEPTRHSFPSRSVANARVRPSLPSPHEARRTYGRIRQELTLAPSPVEGLWRYVTCGPVLVLARQHLIDNDKANGRPVRVVTDEELQLVRKDLRTDGYVFSPPHWERINGKRHAIQAVPDAIVSAVLSLVLGPAWEPMRHWQSFGWRSGESAAQAIQRTKQYLPFAQSVVRLDIADCFETIPHWLVMQQLGTRVREGQTENLIKQLSESMETTPHRGIGRGSILAPLLADIALSAIDRCYPECWPVGNQLILRPQQSEAFSGATEIDTYLQHLPACVPSTHMQHLPANTSTPPTCQPATREQIAARTGQKPAGRPVPRAITTPSQVGDSYTPGDDYTATTTVATTVANRVRVDSLPTTGSRFRHRSHDHTPPAPPIYIRCADDFCVLVGDSGWRRAFAVESELEEQLANCELVASPTKTYVGAVTDSFDFLGLSLRVDRVGGGVAVEPSRSKVYEFERRIDHVIRQNLSGRRTEAGRVMTAVRDATADRLDYARRAGADLGELREFTLQRLRRWSERRGWGLDVDVIPWARVQRHRY